MNTSCSRLLELLLTVAAAGFHKPRMDTGIALEAAEAPRQWMFEEGLGQIKVETYLIPLGRGHAANGVRIKN